MRQVWIGVVSVSVCLACPALGQETTEQQPAQNNTDDLSEYVESQLAEPAETYPYVEHHGYFRFRADNFWNLDLDTAGTSPILPPLEAGPSVETDIPPERGEFFDAEADLIAGANIRFRYHPIFHVTDTARIHAELDFLDNLVLGSTPDGFSVASGAVNARFDTPLVAFSPGQVSPTESNAFRDAIRVRQVYAEMEFLGLLRVGRMASNWGLGILANGGGSYSASPLVPRSSQNRGVPLGGFNCTDCDFGDMVDRFMFVTRILSTVYVGFLYDWPSSGTVGYQLDQPFGQARDLSQLDDVNEFVLTAFRAYFTERERRERDRLIKEENVPVVEGGAYVVFREQTAEQGAGGFFPNDTESAFYPRVAEAIIPDVWVRLQWEPAFRQRIRLELEAVAVLGSIENVRAGLPDPANPEISQRDIQQFGLAFESDFRFDDLTTGLNAGFASGRSTEGDNARLAPGWGILDLNPVTGGDETDRDVTNFKFDRDYTVDMLMFREIIGGITNAIYFDPYIQYNFFTAQANAMGFRFDAIYAMAANEASTPGGEQPIGLELDALVYYGTENYQADVSYGLFVPFGAFDGVRDRARIPHVANFLELDSLYPEDVSASLAHTLQFRLIWGF
jgi:uncharacterized protein (TIGR04551 family)